MRPTGWQLIIKVAVVRAVRPTEWRLTIKVAVVRTVSPTVGDLIQLKWKLKGCSLERPFLYGGLHEAEAS